MRIYLLPAIVDKLLFGLLVPSGRMRISARWYSFFTELQNFSRFILILVGIATTRLIQRRVISYRLLQGRFNQLSGITVQMLMLVAVSAFIYLVYILYQIFFKKSNLFYKSNFIMHWGKSLNILMSHHTQKKIIAVNFFDVNARSVSRYCRTTSWMSQ